MMNLLLIVLLGQSPADLGAAVDALAAVKPGDGAAYAAARDKVLAHGKEAIPALADMSAPKHWTETGWVRALTAEACRVRLASPELAAAADRLEGLDPETYLRYRKPEPAVLRNLAHLGVDTVPLLIERWRWTFESRRYSEGEAGDKERAALRNAILSLPGNVGDPRAGFFLVEVFTNAAAPGDWRRDAAVSLGQVGGIDAIPKLTSALDDAAEVTVVREACARGLGGIGDSAALDAVRARWATEKDPQVRRSYLHGLGTLGSSWGWRARGEDRAAAAESLRAGCAETLIEALRKFPAEAETIGLALGRVRLPSSLAAVEALEKDPAVSGDVRAAAAAILPALRIAISRSR